MISVTCEENLFVKVSSWQYHLLLAYPRCWKPYLPLAAFQSGSLMNALKCQIGVALILKCFFIFDKNQLKQRKISSNLFIVVLTCSIKKIPGIPFSILILAVIHYCSPPKKLKQETNTIFWGGLPTQATSNKSSETRMNITTLKQVIFNTIFHIGAHPYWASLKRPAKCELKLYLSQKLCLEAATRGVL